MPVPRASTHELLYGAAAGAFAAMPLGDVHVWGGLIISLERSTNSKSYSVRRAFRAFVGGGGPRGSGDYW